MAEPAKLDPTTEAVVEIRNLKASIEALRDEFHEARSLFVSRAEFEPVKAIAYGLVGTLLIGVLGALLALVLKK